MHRPTNPIAVMDTNPDTIYAFEFYYSNPMGNYRTTTYYAESELDARDLFWEFRCKDLWKIQMIIVSGVYKKASNDAQNCNNGSPSSSFDNTQDCLSDEIIASRSNDKTVTEINDCVESEKGIVIGFDRDDFSLSTKVANRFRKFIGKSD